MAYLVKRSNGYYSLVFKDTKRTPPSRWVALHTTNKQAAESMKRRYEIQVGTGTFDPWAEPVAEAPTTIQEAVESFLATRGELRPATIRAYRTMLGGLVQRYGGRALSTLGASELKATFQRPELSPTSQATIHRHLKVFCRWLHTEGHVQQNPLLGVRPPKSPNNPKAFLSVEQVEVLLRTIETDYVLPRPHGGQSPVLDIADIVRVLVCTGLRKSELTALQWRDVDLSHGILTVRSDAQHQTKSGRGRAIPLVGDARDVLERLAAARTDEDDRAYVFPGVGGDRLNGHYLSKRFRRAIGLSGLPQGTNLHTLRHTCASWLVMRGTPLYVVKEILGHASISTTQIYSHLAPDVVKAEMERAFQRRLHSHG